LEALFETAAELAAELFRGLVRLTLSLLRLLLWCPDLLWFLCELLMIDPKKKHQLRSKRHVRRARLRDKYQSSQS